MPLTLHDLATEVGDIRVRDRLVQMHLRLDMLSIAPLVQPSHLNVLDLGLCNSRALPCEELLLVLVDYTVLHFVRLRGWTLRFREFLMNIRLNLWVILHARMLVYGDLMRGYLNAA